MPQTEAEKYESARVFYEGKPKSKKAKSGANELKEAEGKAPVSTATKHDEDGNEYWELSRTRRVQISQFKGARMVNIREFYEKDDKMLPGKKGISLSIDQFAAVIDILPRIENVLKAQGVMIPRPNYDAAEPESEAEGEDDGEEEEGEAAARDDVNMEGLEQPATSSRLDKFKLKANHPAPTDEDDEERRKRAKVMPG